MVVAGIKSSTQAINRGEYKSVNLIGVAVIVMTQNLLKELEFPYIFGGDGATLAVFLGGGYLMLKNWSNKKIHLLRFPWGH